MRDDRWEPLLASVISFCEQHEIDIPDMNARYTKGRGRYRRQDDDLTWNIILELAYLQLQ